MEILQFQTCLDCLTESTKKRKKLWKNWKKAFCHQQTLPVTGFIVEIIKYSNMSLKEENTSKRMIFVNDVNQQWVTS